LETRENIILAMILLLKITEAFAVKNLSSYLINYVIRIMSITSFY